VCRNLKAWDAIWSGLGQMLKISGALVASQPGPI
jgi:hypothetical protein